MPTEGGELFLGEELRDRRAHLARLVEDEICEPFGPPLLGKIFQALELCARVLLRDAQEAHARGTREDAELRAARELRRVLELELEAEIRLVGAETAVGLVPGESRERNLELDADRLAPDVTDHALHQVEEELAVRKCHLDVELGDLLDPVRAQVFIPEAACDLVVAIEAGDHEQLLEDLRRLRQREEAARLQPARHDEVARALGGRLEEDRRFDIREAISLHHPTDRRDETRAQAEVALHLRPPQVEPAVAEAQRLVDALLVELEGKRRRAGEDLEPVHLELDLPGRNVGIDRLGRPADNLALRLENELVADRVRRLRRLRCALRIHDELAEARLVAQVDEHETAVVAARVGPAGERQPLPDVLGAHLAAHQVPPFHRASSSTRAASTSCSPRLRTVKPRSWAITTVAAPSR